MSDTGAVRVAVRVRPMNDREKKKNAKCIVSMRDKQTMLTNPNSAQEDIKRFTFDHSYWSCEKSDKHYVGQHTVFRDLGSEVLKSAFDGFNACVFAYGQTGAGKSYTMMGYGDDIGLIPRICEGLFKRVAETTDEKTKYSAVVSYLEIYNEKVRDLLIQAGKPGAGKSLKVREHPKKGPFVDGLSTHEVFDFAEIDELMELGNSNRTTAATGMNDTSSRSHSVFTIEFKQAAFVEGLPSEKTSKINLVDLAGSERTSATGATGKQLVEGGNINKSLTTLGLCISALAKRSEAGKGGKKSFIPYRDSALTWLLKESLGGNSKTIMLAAISPADVNYGETLSTLHYANRAKNIVNKPIVNEDENVRIIRELRAEVEHLKDLLGGDEEIARLESERRAAQEAVDNAGTDEERTEAQAKLDAASKALTDAQGADKSLLAAQIAQSEKMMNAMVNDWRGKFDSMTQILENRGMALKNEGRAVAIESEQPHFVSLNLDDPLATGIVLYYIHEGATTIGRQGLDPEPDIALTHDDVQDLHCLVDYDGVEKVTLEPKNGSMVLINGVREEGVVELHQGTTVQLGESTMFRFNHPVEATRLREARAAGGAGAGHDSVKSMGQVLGDKMRADQERMRMDQEEIRKTQERLQELERQQQERDDAERAAAEQRLQEQALEEEKRKEEEAERERQMSEQLAALQAQIEELQRTKEEEAKQQRELQEAASKAGEEEKKRLLEMEAQLEQERQRRDSLLRAKLKAEEEAAAAAAEASAAAESSMAEVDELRKKKEREHEERKREIEKALEQSRQDHARQEAEATRIREEFKAQEAERERQAREREDKIKRDKEQLQKEYEKRLEQLRAAQDKLQAKGSSRMQFSEVWDIRVNEYKHRGDHYVFKIDISLLGEKWSIWRRFSHFKDLHRLMKSKMKNVASHVSFPPEHRLTTSLRKTHLSDDFLRQRAKDLEIYLNELIQKSFRNAASPFYEVDRSVLERSFAFFRRGGLSQ